MWSAALFASLLSITTALVPKPSKQLPGSELYAIAQPLEIIQEQSSCFILDDAVKRFSERLRIPLPRLPESKTPASTISTLQIKTWVPCNEAHKLLWPHSEMIETYSIHVQHDAILIDAQEIWGALHALESVLQLLYRTETNQMVIFQQVIVDGPRFPHRGYLIDTSRHFLPVPDIYRFLDAMAMVKMNVLHWHIVDTQSFPYKSARFPKLSNKGAFDPLVFVYTRNDVLDILNYARKRAIRVMVEFDTPGHAESWGRGYPEILTECSQGPHRYGPMNPAKRETYDFLLSFFQEILNVFPDEWIHLGGDEVDFNCWKSNPEIRHFMEEKKFGNNYSKLQSYFTEQVLQLVEYAKPDKRALRPIVWQEVFDNGFNIHNETIIHIWKSGAGEIKRVTKAGYDVLFSTCWYLNYIQYGIDWPRMYNCDPAQFNGTAEEISRVRGGEAAMWGEYVDETNLFSRSWPRGAAVAERLWSTGNLSQHEFTPRLDRLRCQMVRRGWNAESSNGPGFCSQ